jgi:hypothetical protein
VECFEDALNGSQIVCMRFAEAMRNLGVELLVDKVQRLKVRLKKGEYVFTPSAFKR